MNKKSFLVFQVSCRAKLSCIHVSFKDLSMLRPTECRSYPIDLTQIGTCALGVSFISRGGGLGLDFSPCVSCPLPPQIILVPLRLVTHLHRHGDGFSHEGLHCKIPRPGHNSSAMPLQRGPCDACANLDAARRQVSHRPEGYVAL